MAIEYRIERRRLGIGKFSLYYEQIGSGPALVFLHGLGGNHLSWWQQVPYFMRWFRCITLDQRGFGLSPDPEDRFNDAHSSDLELLLDELKIGKAVLVGQSMGGWTITGYALAHPERVAGMVMAGTIGGIFTPEMRPHFATPRPPLDREPPIGSLPTYATDYFLHRPEKAFLYDDLRVLGAQPPVDGMARVGAKRYELSEAKAKLKMPVLCVVGEQDVLMPPPVVQALAASLPDARMVTVPDCGHSTYFEQPQIFNQVVLDFVRSIGFGRGA